MATKLGGAGLAYGLASLATKLSPFLAMLSLSGDEPKNDYATADADKRKKMRASARNYTDRFNAASEMGDRRKGFDDATSARPQDKAGGAAGLIEHTQKGWWDLSSALNTIAADVASWKIERNPLLNKGTEVSASGHNPPEQKYANYFVDKLMGGIDNYNGHAAKMSGDGAVPPVIDNRQDNRDQSISVNPSVAVTVQQIAAAASATATKTAEAVTGALKNVPSTSRTMRSAHF